MNIYAPGALINDRYEVVSRPLMGGMGIVYLCIDHKQDRPVALKTFKSEYLPDREARDRFLREGTAWIELGNHPHVVRCYGVERVGDGSEVFLILEQVAKEQGRDDPSLRSWLHLGRPLPIEQALLFALQIARGMKHAVAKIPGFVHRDLKPENVLVGADYIPSTNINRLRVTDFGLASVLNTNVVQKPDQQPQNADFMGRTQLTYGVVGTPLYMSPEQWKGEPISIATDVYALGCILYEMILGQLAVSADSLEELQRKHCEGKISPVRVSLSTDIAKLLIKCLSPKPAERFTDWETAVTALENAYQNITRKTAPVEETAKDLSRVEQLSIGLGYANLGGSYFDIGKAETALQYFERALSIAQIHGDQGLESVALGGLGMLFAYLGEKNQAIEYSEKALIINRSVGNKLGESVLLSQLGTVYKNTGNVQRALEYHKNATGIARQIGDRRAEGNFLNALGIDYKYLGDAKRAMECYEQALIINDEFEDRGLKVNILINMGIAHKNLNATQDAIQCYEQALAIARDIGDRDGEGKCLSNLGNIYLLKGNAQKAIPFIEQSIEITKETGNRRAEGIQIENLGMAYANLGDRKRAIKLLDQSVIIFEEIGDLNNIAQVLYDKSRILAENGDIDQAILLAKESMQIWTHINHPNAKPAEVLLTKLIHNGTSK